MKSLKRFCNYGNHYKPFKVIDRMDSKVKGIEYGPFTPEHMFVALEKMKAKGFKGLEVVHPALDKQA